MQNHRYLLSMSWSTQCFTVSRNSGRSAARTNIWWGCQTLPQTHTRLCTKKAGRNNASIAWCNLCFRMESQENWTVASHILTRSCTHINKDWRSRAQPPNSCSQLFLFGFWEVKKGQSALCSPTLNEHLTHKCEQIISSQERLRIVPNQGQQSKEIGNFTYCSVRNN